MKVMFGRMHMLKKMYLNIVHWCEEYWEYWNMGSYNAIVC